MSNLTALRATVGISAQTAYVKGHTTAGDGGGGMFIWSTDAAFTTGVYAIDNNGTIIQATGNNTGRWVRQYEDFINVKFFGAFGLGGDYTLHIQRAIDFAALNSISYTLQSIVKGATVFIPNGDYTISSLTLKHKVNVMGESLEETRLHCNGQGSAVGMFEIERGPVFVNVSNLHCLGEGTSKTCFNLEAKGEDPQNPNTTHGGLWYSTFKNIQVKLFKGDGIVLKGGGNYLLPNQFNIFENVRVFKNSDFTHALKMIGQNGQHTFLNCQFDGFYNTTTATWSLGHNVYIQNSTSITTAVASFINSTFQDGNYGIYMEYAENVTIDNCWFENLGVAVTTRPTCKAITITNSRFANAAGFGSLSAPNNIKNGHCFSITTSFVSITNNYITVSNPNNIDSGLAFLVTMSNSTTGGVHLANNIFSDQRLDKTNNIPQITSGITLNVGANRLVNTNLAGINGYTAIESRLNTGEYLTVRATDSIYFGASSRLFLGGKSQLNLSAGEMATFVKLDYANNTSENFALVSFTKSGSV
ncbi:hypothetical protein ACLI09_04180 [Flavobacterium sp. RHBU_24]|uniref:hypothetical protein n=1 Tax=Flavobacterium sp. RHBU_24 TaxID=3391185 RepID=UPI0039855C56